MSHTNDPLLTQVSAKLGMSKDASWDAVLAELDTRLSPTAGPAAPPGMAYIAKAEYQRLQDEAADRAYASVFPLQSEAPSGLGTADAALYREVWPDPHQES